MPLKCAVLTQGWAVGHLVVLVRHLWLALSHLPEKVTILDAPLSPEYLFGPSMQDMRERFKTTQKSMDMFKTSTPPPADQAQTRPCLNVGRRRAALWQSPSPWLSHSSCRV